MCAPILPSPGRRKVAADVALQRREAEAGAWVPVDDEEDGAVAEVADAVEQDHGAGARRRALGRARRLRV